MYHFLVNQITYLLYSAGLWVARFFVAASILRSEWTDYPTEPSQQSYDYIIVGAGTAGTTILAAMPPNINVLLVEAGLNNDMSLLKIPIITPALHGSSLDWSFRTEPQVNACGAMKEKRCRLAAGRGNGGSNIINNMIYHRGDPEDYRGWFEDPDEYNYERDILPVFKQLEDELLPAALQHVTVLGRIFSQFDANLNDTSYISFSTPRVLQNDGYRRGIGRTDKSNSNSVHHEHVYGALAVKLAFADSKKDYITGLEIKKNNRISRVSATKGYIIAAGAIGTPKLLLHSGIGPCSELEQLQIPCQVNLPGVGKNLQDHIATGLDLITLNTSLGLGLKEILNPLNIYKFFLNKGKSPWSTIGCEAVGFHKLAGKSREKPSLGFMVLPMGISSDGGACLIDNLNIEDKVWHEYFNKLQKFQTISILPIILQPTSRGYVKLESDNIEKPPIVNPQYLSNRKDVDILVDGIKLIKDTLLNHPRLKKLGARIVEQHLPGCEDFQLFTPEYWNCYVRKLSFSVYHLAGTCRMGNLEDSETVVNKKNFLVKGIDNLYIADASIMPNLPSGNINAAVALIAKRFMQILHGEKSILKNFKSDSSYQQNTKIFTKSTKLNEAREDL